MPKRKKQGKKRNPPKLQQDTDADKRSKRKKKGKKRNPPKLQQDPDAGEWSKLKEQLKSPKYDVLYNIFDSQGKDEISSGNNETDNPVTTGCNQGEKEDINLPHSSCSGSSKARASGQKANQKSDRFKKTKNINLPNSSSKKRSSLYNTGHQVDQKNSSKKPKKTKNDRIPQKEKSQIKTNLPVLKNTKTITENTILSSNIDEARQSCSHSVPIKYSDKKKCQKDDQAITQVKAENKATAKVETLEPDKSMELVSNTLNSIPQTEHRQKTEDLTKEKKKLQQKLRTCEEEKLLNEQEQKLLSPVKESKNGIKGRIEVLVTANSVKSNKESSLSSEYEKGSGKIFIKDQNIKITIDVTEGIQVVCKSTRPITDLVEDFKSSSNTLEGYSTESPEDIKTDLVDVEYSSCTLEGHTAARPEDIKTDSEHFFKPTSDTNLDPHTMIKFSNENCPTVDDQATVLTVKNTLIDSEKPGETGDDTNQGSSSVGEFPKERNSSRITSLQENIQKVSNEYEKDIQAACEEFGRKMENYIKRNSFKSSDI